MVGVDEDEESSNEGDVDGLDAVGRGRVVDA